MSEVPNLRLSIPLKRAAFRGKWGEFCCCRAGGVKLVQGYLTSKKTHLLGPYRMPIPRILGRSQGVGVFL